MSSICDYTPALALAVDTSQLSSIPNYNSVMAADVQSSYTVGNEGFVGSIETFYREYVEPTLLSIANDTKRQADKNEQTVVKLNSRTLTQAVTDQQKANGYVFTK